MFKVYLLNSANYPTEIYNDANIYNPIVFEPELEMNGDNGILIGKLAFKLHEPSYSPDFRLLQNTVIVTQMISGVETVIFRGRPLLRDDDDYNDQDFTFEGILAGLNDTLQTPSNKRGVRFYKHFKNIVDWHNHQVQSISNNRQINYSKITNDEGPNPDSYMYTITERDPVGILWENMLEYTRYRASTMDHIKSQYVEARGGFFYLENEPLVYDSNGCVVLHNYLKYIDIYNPDQTHVNTQRIEFGKNLISIKRSASADDFATVLVPLGKQLTDVEKSWPYYQSVENNKVRKIVSSPDDAVLENYNSTNAYINSETAAVTTGGGSSYVILNDVEVEPGDVFYLTTYLEGFSTDVSAASYAILTRDATKVFSIGSSVRNSKDSGGTVTVKNLALKDERIEIPTPEDDTVQLKLRTAYMISANDPNGGYILKKFNSNYQEENVTIMSADPQTTGAIRKTGQYAIGRDVYPDATDTPIAPESYEQSKRLVHHELYEAFGAIEKSIELTDYGFDKMPDLVYWASLNLEKMGEDLEIEIQAADLSYIDESQEPFQPYDLVPVYSEPHGIDMMLPIVKMTLPLADPAAATYTLQNDIHLSEDGKKYISQMVSSPGAGTQKNQTVIVYSGGGSSGGGSGEQGPPGPAGADGYSPTVAIATITGGHTVTITDANGYHSFDVMDGSGSDVDPDDIFRTVYAEKASPAGTIRMIKADNTTAIPGSVLVKLVNVSHGGCLLMEVDSSYSNGIAYEVDEITDDNISFYRIADGKRHVITVPLNSNQGTYSVSDVVDIPEQGDELPTINPQTDEGKVLGVVNGVWAVKDDEDSDNELPEVTASDNGKVLGVVDGVWAIKDDEDSDNELPEVTASDNGKVLGVVNGVWAVKDDETGDTLPEINSQTDEGKVLGIVNGEWAVKNDEAGDDNVQSDWEQTDTAADDYIKNKCNSLTALLYNETQQNVSDKNGTVTGDQLVQDYFQQSQLTNHLMYVYDWSGNVYHLHSVDRDTNEIKFKRRVGDIDTILTLTGDSPTVIKSTESIYENSGTLSVILTLDSNRQAMNGDSTITGEEIRALVNSGKMVSLWDAAHNRMFQYIGVGPSTRPTFVSVWGDTQYKIAVYANAPTTEETTSSLPSIPVPTHSDVGKALVVAESNNEQFYVLQTLPSISNALIYDTQLLTDEQKLQSRKNLGLYGATVIFLYDGTHLTTLSRTDGIQSANTIINNYYGNDSTILDHNFLFVYDNRNLKYYIFETFNNVGENNYRVVFRRRDGMYDKYLTLVGDNTNVAESSRKIDVEEAPDVVFYRHYLADKYSEDGTTILFHENSITAFQRSGAEVAISGNAIAERILSGTAVYIIDSGYYVNIYVPFYIQNYAYVAFRSTDSNGNEKLLYLNWDSSIAEVRVVQALPGVSSSDNGKFLGVVNGQWTITNPDHEPTRYDVWLNDDGTLDQWSSDLTFANVDSHLNDAFGVCLRVHYKDSIIDVPALDKALVDDALELYSIIFSGTIGHSDGSVSDIVFSLWSYDDSLVVTNIGRENSLYRTDDIIGHFNSSLYYPSTRAVYDQFQRKPVVVWEVQDATQGLSALNANITSSLAWQLTNLNMAPFKRIKIYSRAGRKTGSLAADSSITPASIIEMSLDDRAKETVSQNVFIGSSVVQNPNDPNRLGILTCAVSADKTKFAVVRATTLYGTAATSNTDAYPCVFKIEGYYD